MTEKTNTTTHTCAVSGITFKTADEDEIIKLRVHKLLSEKELEQLRKEKLIWQKVCKYEKEKYLTYAKCFPGLGSEKEKEHFKNLDELAGENK